MMKFLHLCFLWGIIIILGTNWLISAEGIDSQKDDDHKNDARLNVGLVAQVSPSEDMIVGSIITTRSLRNSFVNLKDQFNLNRIELSYPYDYGNFFHVSRWDIIIIEGWFPSINAFIHEARNRQNTPVKIIFYCLDPTYPHFSITSNLHVDYYFTNSKVVATSLSQIVPTLYLNLAADKSLISNAIAITEEESEKTNKIIIDNNEKRKVVFIGSAIGMETKRNLGWILRESIPYGLEIYGSGWYGYPEFEKYWKGVLPEDGIGEVYANAFAILGVTMDDQRDLGMVNNRVFEALASGRPFLCEHFDKLEEEFENHIYYIKDHGDVEKYLDALSLQDDAFVTNKALAARDFIEKEHSYDKRVIRIFDFLSNHSSSSSSSPLSSSVSLASVNNNITSNSTMTSTPTNSLKIGVLVHPELNANEMTLRMTLLPALNTLNVKSLYKVIFIDYNNFVLKPDLWYPILDIIFVVSEYGGTADLLLRSTNFLHDYITARGQPIMTALFLWGSTMDFDNIIMDDKDGKEGIEFYDLIYCKTDYDVNKVKPYHTNVQKAFGIYMFDEFYQQYIINDPELAYATEQYKETLKKIKPNNRLLVLDSSEDYIYPDSTILEEYLDTVKGQEDYSDEEREETGNQFSIVILDPKALSQERRKQLLKLFPLAFIYDKIKPHSIDISLFRTLIERSQSIHLIRNSNSRHSGDEFPLYMIYQIGYMNNDDAKTFTVTSNTKEESNEDLEELKRLQSLFFEENTRVSTTDNYVDDIRIGITKLFCKRSSRTRIHFQHPVDNAVIMRKKYHYQGNNDTTEIPIVVDLENFIIGRDGKLCMKINGKRFSHCAITNDFQFFLEAPPSSLGISEFTIEAILQSNLYLDEITSKSITVSIDDNDSSSSNNNSSTVTSSLDESILVDLKYDFSSEENEGAYLERPRVLIPWTFGFQ